MAVTWPPGILSAGVACGIKRGGVPDLGVIVADDDMAWAGTFTKNAAAAAGVVWSRGLLGKQVRALVVNSGNANACTGAQGAAAVETTAQETARIVGCKPQQVLIASTGPIGIQLPVDLVMEGLPRAVAELSEDPGTFARSILTTDTVSKTSSIRLGNASIVGVAKGAAMLAPSMATMLAYVVTDAAMAAPLLQAGLEEAVARSFDCICVDACESTNDSVFLLATGSAGPVDPDLFAKGLQEVCSDLAEQIVRDAEGATRFLRLRVSGATDDHAARALGRAIAASALWRAAVHGSDPNWGRVLAALGAADRTLDPTTVELRIGQEIVYTHGEPTESLEGARRAMAQGDIVLACDVGDGPGRSEVLTTDLSPDYVNLNAHGTT
ncbi:MAG: bifunctional glutamate N-acetyltransferase/amino-acid acetyltransferase ArgJ [Actinomycetota bacterium]